MPPVCTAWLSSWTLAKPVTSGCLNPKGQVQPQLPALTGGTWAGMQHQALFAAWKATRRLSSEVMWVAGCFGLFFRGHSQGWCSTTAPSTSPALPLQTEAAYHGYPGSFGVSGNPCCHWCPHMAFRVPVGRCQQQAQCRRLSCSIAGSREGAKEK